MNNTKLTYTVDITVMHDNPCAVEKLDKIFKKFVKASSFQLTRVHKIHEISSWRVDDIVLEAWEDDT